MADRTPTTVWRLRPELVLALDEHLGPPIDGYVNGSQVWLADHGPGEIALEWRLHPVSGFRQPEGLGVYELWDAVVGALGTDRDPDALPLGNETRPLCTLWDGLECFPAYGEEVDPVELAQATTVALTFPPDAVGLADHEVIGRSWERERGKVSITEMLFEQLSV